MEKEEEGGMTGYEDETIRNPNISSQQAKPQIISDTTRDKVQRKSLSEVISETNLFSDTECGNGVLSSSKELNGDCGITIPSDLDSVSPIPFNLDQTLPDSYLNSDGNTRSECDNVLTDAQQQKCNMSKDNPADDRCHNQYRFAKCCLQNQKHFEPKCRRTLSDLDRIIARGNS